MFFEYHVRTRFLIFAKDLHGYKENNWTIGNCGGSWNADYDFFAQRDCWDYYNCLACFYRLQLLLPGLKGGTAS